MGDGKGDFRMMNRAMTDSILELKEYNRYMKGIFSFVGFDTKWIPFHNTERAAGKTKWNFRSLFRYAMDGMLSFSSAPASLPGFIGIFLLIAAVVTGLVSVFTGHKDKLDPSACLPDPRVERHTDDLPVTARTIYVERLYGKQETTDLYYKKERGVLTPPFLRQL